MCCSPLPDGMLFVFGSMTAGELSFDKSFIINPLKYYNGANLF